MSRELVELLIIAALIGLIIGATVGVFIGMSISRWHHSQMMHHVMKAGQRSRANYSGAIDYEDAEDLFRR